MSSAIVHDAWQVAVKPEAASQHTGLSGVAAQEMELVHRHQTPALIVQASRVVHDFVLLTQQASSPVQIVDPQGIGMGLEDTSGPFAWLSVTPIPLPSLVLPEGSAPELFAPLEAVVCAASGDVVWPVCRSDQPETSVQAVATVATAATNILRELRPTIVPHRDGSKPSCKGGSPARKHPRMPQRSRK
jgi:hypothetical protein